jgi:hypothetical protein
VKIATSTILVFAFVAVAGCQKQSQTPAPGTPDGQACTMEAKVCPDGSSVGRTGPNCEFAPCPGPNDGAAPAPDGTPGDGQSSPPVPSEDEGPDDEL